MFALALLKRLIIVFGLFFAFIKFAIVIAFIVLIVSIAVAMFRDRAGSRESIPAAVSLEAGLVPSGSLEPHTPVRTKSKQFEIQLALGVELHGDDRWNDTLWLTFKRTTTQHPHVCTPAGSLGHQSRYRDKACTLIDTIPIGFRSSRTSQSCSPAFPQPHEGGLLN